MVNPTIQDQRGRKEEKWKCVYGVSKLPLHVELLLGLPLSVS